VSYSYATSLTVVGVPKVLPSIGAAGNFQLWDDCTVGSPCRLNINATEGGTAPFTYSANPSSLPPGLSVKPVVAQESPYSAYPTQGQIVGVPTTPGSYTIEVTITDADGKTATSTFPLNVRVLQQTNTLIQGTYNSPYSSRVRVIGGTVQPQPDGSGHFTYP